MPFARFVSDEDAPWFQRAPGRADGEPLIFGMVQRIEEDRGVILPVQVELLEVAADEVGASLHAVDPRIVARHRDHIRSDVLAGHGIAMARVEDAGPAAAAAQVQQARGRGGQQAHDEADGGQLNAAGRIGERLVERVVDALSAEFGKIGALGVFWHLWSPVGPPP